MTIKDFMIHQHRACDQLLTMAEDSVEKKDFDDAMIKYKNFEDETLKHFTMEEEYLFPLFGEKSGMGSGGPVQIMLMEHEQARNLFDKIVESLEQKDADRFYGLSESLLILLQQHNAKEEQMLYTMIQNTLNQENDEIVEKLMNYGK